MLRLNNDINHIVTEPLPPEIGSELLSAIEAAAILRASLQVSPVADLIYEAVVLDELRYAYLLAGEEYSFRDLLTVLSCRQLHDKLSKSTNFLEEKLSKHSLIPATDLLRVSEYIRTGKMNYLHGIVFSDACSNFAEQINDVLDIAYNTCAGQHEFIKIAVICCCLGFTKGIGPLAPYALCSVIINQNDTLSKLPLSVCRFFLLEGPFEGQSYSLDGKQSIVAFLQQLRCIFTDALLLLQDMKTELENLYEKVRIVIPGDSVPVIEHILSTKLSFIGAEIQDAAQVTYRTAFEYLRRLKTNGIIDSVRVGKENIYISMQMLSRIERGLFNGAKKS